MLYPAVYTEPGHYFGQVLLGVFTVILGYLEVFVHTNFGFCTFVTGLLSPDGVSILTPYRVDCGTADE